MTDSTPHTITMPAVDVLKDALLKMQKERDAYRDELRRIRSGKERSEGTLEAIYSNQMRLRAAWTGADAVLSRWEPTP